MHNVNSNKKEQIKRQSYEVNDRNPTSNYYRFWRRDYKKIHVCLNKVKKLF